MRILSILASFRMETGAGPCSTGCKSRKDTATGWRRAWRCFGRRRHTALRRSAITALRWKTANGPKTQQQAFQKACVDAVEMLKGEAAGLRVVGNTQSDCFPKALLPYTERTYLGHGSGTRVNFW